MCHSSTERKKTWCKQASDKSRAAVNFLLYLSSIVYEIFDVSSNRFASHKLTISFLIYILFQIVSDYVEL